jgi:predicted MPP superfamily phosphohydrolase
VTKHFIILVIIWLLAFIWMLIEARSIKILYYNITDLSPNIKIPTNFKWKKIVFISDIQLNSSFWFADGLAKKIIGLTQEENPDIILFWWDFINFENKSADKIFTYLAELKAPLWKYWVLGNHDYVKEKKVTNGAFVKKMLSERAWINLLLNENVEIKIGDESIKIVGIDDFWYWDINIEKAMNWVTKDDTTIFMMHNPDYFEVMPENYKSIVDLTLAGHTHSWQITLFWLWAPFTPSDYWKKYLYWAKNFDGNRIYITSWVWWVPLFGLPLRFFARPEIVVIRF